MSAKIPEFLILRTNSVSFQILANRESPNLLEHHAAREQSLLAIMKSLILVRTGKVAFTLCSLLLQVA